MRTSSAEAFDLVRAAGYEGVCSSYGGWNCPGDDPFHIRRHCADGVPCRAKDRTIIDPIRESRRHRLAYPHFEQEASVSTVSRRGGDRPSTVCKNTRDIMATLSLADCNPETLRDQTGFAWAKRALLLAMAAVQRVVGFGRSILLCRWLAKEELGHWDLTLAFLELAAPIAILSLPACFGRYVEHYRQQGHLRTFVKRTSLAILLLTACSAMILCLGRRGFSYLLYGDSESVA